MEDSSVFLKIGNICLFVILTFLGVIFLLAAPVDPSSAVSRLLVGIILIIVAIVILVIISLIIQRKKYKVVKVIKDISGQEQKYVPSEIVCKNCNNQIELTEDLKKKDKVICEMCGEEIKIPKDNVNW